jgi:glycerate-2-kinase
VSPATARLREDALALVRAALAAADPRAAVLRALSARSGSGGPTLTIRGSQRVVRGRIAIAAIGKAAPAMSAGALEALAPVVERLAWGLVVLPRGLACRLGAAGDGFEILESSHPVPDEAGVAAARRLVALVGGLDDDDLLLFLLSGGGSSLLPLPAEPVSLADKAAVTSLLLASGADITEINTVRKHLSDVKGGRLAAGCRGAVETLAVSDVVGDRLDFIASGPTVPDPTTFADALGVLVRHGLADRVPAAVRARLEDGAAGRVPETPKQLPDRHRAGVIASNRIALDAAAAEAGRRGYVPRIVSTSLTGEAREAGAAIAAAAKEALRDVRAGGPPACLVWGGETTVTLRGSGRGGRNQEIALAAALEIDGLDDVLIASFATDGKEGNTDAAGAFASGATIAAGENAGCDASATLAANDSYTFLAAAGDLIVTGPTGTNVNDLGIALVGRPRAAT